LGLGERKWEGENSKKHAGGGLLGRMDVDPCQRGWQADLQEMGDTVAQQKLHFFPPAKETFGMGRIGMGRGGGY